MDKHNNLWRTLQRVSPRQWKEKLTFSKLSEHVCRAVDPTMLVALSAIAADQAAPTKNTLEKVDQLLDYAVSQEDAVITYRASDMVLTIHSDASYLSEPKARSRSGGNFSCQATDRCHPTMALYLHCAKLYKLSCPQLVNPRLVPCT